MKHMSIALLLLSVCLICTCTEITYDNPVDPEGINRELFLQHPDYLGDEDGDGIINFVDRNYYINKALVTPPVITLVGGDTVMLAQEDKANLLSMYKDVNNPNVITAIEPGGLPVKITVVADNVDIYTVNNPATPYTITYQAEDDSGDVATAIRYVNVISQIFTDTIPPNLMIGDTIVTILVGKSFDDSKNYAFDIGDASQIPITIEGSVDTSTPGTYVLKYTAQDSKGNSVSATRTVIVRDIEKKDETPPKITLLGSDTLTLVEGQTIEEFIAAYKEPGYTAIDDVDGDITSKVIVSEIKQQNNALYIITYNVFDEAGNVAIPARRFIKTGEIATIFAPVIMLILGDSIIQIKVNGTWREPGFHISDAQDKVIPSSKAIVDSSDLISHLDVPGIYTITYIVTNSVGLSDTAIRKVEVTMGNDRSAPVITLLGRNPDTVLVKSTEYIDPGVMSIDAFDGDISESVIKYGEIDFDRLGKNTILYSSADKAGNKASATRIVWVVPDTLTTDLFVRYLVPSPDPLPKVSGAYTTFDIDGEGPDLIKSNVKKIEFQWDAPNKQFQLYITADQHKTLSSISQNLGSEEPSINLVGSGIDKLDGKYYVTIKDDTLVWVRDDKSFALLLSK